MDKYEALKILENLIEECNDSDHDVTINWIQVKAIQVLINELKKEK